MSELNLIEGLQKIEGLQILGNVDQLKKSGHLVSFNVDGMHAHDIGALVSNDGSIAVRSGNHCAQPLHQLLGVDASLRVSFYLYNTVKDVDFFLTVLNKVVSFLK